jgi:3-dehydroquinate synthetase
MTCTLELARFRTKPGTDEAAFLKASEQVMAWVSAREGFQYRTLVEAGGGEWLDLVYWADETAARASGAAFVEAPETQAMLSMIDLPSVEVRRMPQRQAAAAPAVAEAA